MFSRCGDWSTGSNDLTKLASKRFTCLGVVLVTPNNNLQHLRADFSPALQRSSQAAAGRPILGFGGGDIFVGRTRIPIAIENVKGHAAIVESIGTDRQTYSVDNEHVQAVVALHGSAAGGKTNIRAMNFNKACRGPARQ